MWKQLWIVLTFQPIGCTLHGVATWDETHVARMATEAELQVSPGLYEGAPLAIHVGS